MLKNKCVNILKGIKDKITDFYTYLFFEKEDENLKYEFLPSALEIAQTPPSPIGAGIIIGIFFIILTFIVWASVGKVDEVAVARGKIVPNGRLKVVQPLEEGVITAIFVDEGERVKKGQILLELDASIKKVDENAILRDLDIALMEKTLLDKYLKGEDILSIKKYVESTDMNEDTKGILEDFAISRVDYYNSKKEKLTLLQTQANEDLSSENAELGKLEKSMLIASERESKLRTIKNSAGAEAINIEKIKLSVDALSEELNKSKELYKLGVISKEELDKKENELNFMKKEYEVQVARGSIESDGDFLRWKNANDELELIKKDIELQKIRVKQAQIKLDEAKSNFSNLDKQNEEETLSLIVEKQKEIEHLKSSLEKAQKSIEYKSLVSPVNGLVQGISSNTIGGVVTPAQSIMTIVPEHTPLVVEAMVANKDIGFIREGQHASIKIDTFSFQRYGILNGKIEKISPDAFEDEKYGSVYKIKVSLEKDDIVVDRNIVKLSPGMSVTVEVKTGERRIISFFFDPLVKYLHEALTLR